MPETYFEASLREAGHSWRALRRRRAKPPVPRVDGNATPSRAATFQVALEQAEQQFRAAASIGYESRALNLYYGLQQAGRAIAAACPDFGDDSYRFIGHGLSVTPEPGSRELKDLWTVGVKRESGKLPVDAFSVVSRALRSDLPDKIALRQVWPLLVEPNYARNSGIRPTIYQPLGVYLSSYEPPKAPASDQSATIELPSVLRSSDQWPEVEEYLSRYPSLSGCNPHWPALPQLSWELWWTLPEESDRHILEDRLTVYRGQKMAFPTLTPDRAETMHPLMAWWTVLYALSVLTRYAPSDWTRLVDIDRSSNATAIEFVLDRAVDAVPDLIDEAIALVTGR